MERWIRQNEIRRNHDHATFEFHFPSSVLVGVPCQPNFKMIRQHPLQIVSSSELALSCRNQILQKQPFRPDKNQGLR